MTIRHKAYKETLDRGYASEWNDDHKIDFTEEVTCCWTFCSHVVPEEFTVSAPGGATVATALYDNHNWLEIQTTGAAGNTCSIILGDRDTTNKLDLPVLNIAMHLDTTALFEFGFFDYDTAAFTANQRGAYFRIVNNVLYAVTGTGAAETTTNLGAPPAYGHYKIEWLSASVKFYVDDMENAAATHTANITADDVTVRASAKNPNGDVQTMYVDAIGLQRLRKQ